VAALNGHRDRLSDEALQFCGVSRSSSTASAGWTQPNNLNDQGLEDLAKLRAVMPGYLALTRAILEPSSKKKTGAMSERKTEFR
jgi:hypothetical protein